MTQRRVGEQGADGGEAEVASASAVVAIDFQMIEEGTDETHVEILPAKR